MRELMLHQEKIITFILILICIRLACGSLENFVALLMLMMTGGTFYLIVK